MLKNMAVNHIHGPILTGAGSVVLAVMLRLAPYMFASAASLTFVKNPTQPIMLGHTEPDVIKGTYYMYYRKDSTNGASINVMEH